MRTLRLTIAYDGTRYAGWQIQRRGGPTIQATIERVLARILREPAAVVASGRTDAGVHALAQVAHVRVRSSLPCERLARSLNALLPPDITVTRIGETSQAFHARFSAVSKRYRYRIFTGAVVPPFERLYVHHVPVRLNVALMRREARALEGRHDFRAFARAAGPRRSTRRTIHEVAVRRRGEELHIEIAGNGFLHTMVRSLAGTLIDVGRGRFAPGAVRRLLRNGQRRAAGTTAPAKGLVLVSVSYPATRRVFTTRSR